MRVAPAFSENVSGLALLALHHGLLVALTGMPWGQQRAGYYS